ncbi:hypothetical protein SELMODRAFT_446381 [Selaginella moellendorffii]|uniref:Hint domain-containing protein n=2 Tax=Selaginella moellendorffii TaxID=88036 RepID=D8SQW9_SELML|nr:hypothetical protein SELMODRAFT_446381 [Selaginella moellendorffii]
MASLLFFLPLISLVELIPCVTAQSGEACLPIPDNCTAGFKCRKIVVNGMKTFACIADGCFPGDALVHLYDGGSRAMKDLKIGDKVAGGPGSGYSEIYAFGHKELDAAHKFLQVKTDESVLELTAGHFIPVQVEEKLVYKRAADLKVDDRLFTRFGVSQVTELSEVEKLGLYNPLTLSGHILVNDIVASVHSEWFLDSLFDALGVSQYLPSSYQLLLSPIRALYKLAGRELYSTGYAMLNSFVNVDEISRKFGGTIVVTMGLLGTLAVTSKLIKEM